MGSIVAVAGGRSIGLVVAMLAVARAGAAYLPVDAHAPIERSAALLTDAGVRLVVAADDAAMETCIPGLETVFHHVEGDADVPCAAGPEDPCYLNFTSGSTGRPKGVVVPHRAVSRLVTNAKFCDVSPGDRVANLANPAFDATTFEIWHALTAGATVVVFPAVTDLTLTDWIALLRDERITAMFLTTSLFHMIARERPDAFATLETLIVGGEQLDIGAVRRVLADRPPRRLVNGYGPTETTTFAASFDCTADALAGLDRVPIGFPLQETRLSILDSAQEPVAAGAVGELCVGGPGVALGYLNQPELTAERFVSEPGFGESLMYRTGDLARVLPSGAFELLGRADDQVKLRGFRIELGEIEQAIRATGLVDHVYVLKIGEGPAAFLAAFLLAAQGHSGLADRLPALLGAKLPGYMVPARWVELTELPAGPTGKVDRNALVAMVSAQTPNTEGAAGDDNGGLTDEIEGAWRAVLNVDAVSPTDNFLDLGGNSILAIQLTSRLREALAIELRPAEVLLADSLGELTDRIRQVMATT